MSTAQPAAYECKECHNKGIRYCGGLLIKQGNSGQCCSCLKYTGDKRALAWSFCMREVSCECGRGRK